MPEGTQPEPQQPMTVDQQLSAQVGVAMVFNVANRMFGTGQQYEAGGGGADGHYNIASIAELDALIARWQGIAGKIEAAGSDLREAARNCVAPAGDQASDKATSAARVSFGRAVDHNRAMRKYAEDYVGKLTAVRHNYETTEGHNTGTVAHSDGA
jgi:hypothetical protein